MQALQTTPAAKQWDRVGIHHHHGINIPLFSLHSKDSCGIGEYYDLLPLISWCQQLGLSIIQLLPLNDTGGDNSPYSAISAFALNPLHLSLKALPDAASVPIPPELTGLANTPRIDYRSVRMGKEKFLRAYFQRQFAIVGKTKDYQQFLSAHQWLDNYALFRALKQESNWQPWKSWASEVAHPTAQTLKEMKSTYAAEMNLHRFIQYLCFQQMQAVKKAANAVGVFLKGDIPICCGAESADAWLESKIFLPGYTAGAPPDRYSQEGQNWGFPVYDWKELEKRNYDWWRQRLAVADHLYDLYRIDHIVGLFRIWAIPEGKSGENGLFLPKDPKTWIEHGKKILLMLLNSSSMLPVGEDLGTIPPEVRVCLRELGICGTKVMRWERAWKEDGRLIPVSEYEPISMTTVSTHDSDTESLWWQNSPGEAELYCTSMDWSYAPTINQQYLFEILRASHLSTSLLHINLLHEYLSLIPDLAWPEPAMDRINLPGVISEKNWSYRFRPSVETIVSHAELSTLFRRLFSARRKES